MRGFFAAPTALRAIRRVDPEGELIRGAAEDMPSKWEICVRTNNAIFHEMQDCAPCFFRQSLCELMEKCRQT